MSGSRIVGWGSNLPEKVLTNHDLAEMMDTSDEWIRERTGISERRIGGSTVSMGIASAQQALDRASLGPDDIDLLIVATTSPDQQLPASSATIHQGLGLSCGAFDVNAACAGFAYGLVTAESMLAGGIHRVLVIGTDSLSRMTDPTDRSTAILFADGAGAVILESTDDGDSALLGWDLGCDGKLSHILYADHGDYIKMEGREVFRQAVRAVVASATAAMERAGVTIADIDHFIPHQANIRIIDSVAAKLDLPREKAISNIDHTGNTSAASIPLALCEAVDERRIVKGDLLLISGFGAGMTWASAVVRWDA